jgi:hypothetical protein
MSQLVLDDLPGDLLDRLEHHARQLGVSVTEAAARILTRALPPAGPSASPSGEPLSGPFMERGGLLLHTGQLAPGVAWPDVVDLREERADELSKRALEGGV